MEAHPLSSCYPSQGTFRTCKFATTSLKLQLLSWYKLLWLYRFITTKLTFKQNLHRSFSQERHSCKRLNGFGHVSSSFTGYIPQNNSLLHSAQLYQTIWAKFPPWTTVIASIYSPHYGQSAPKKDLLSKHVVLLTENPSYNCHAQGLDSKVKA